MELYVLNQELERVGTVDVYESFIWSPCYNEVGSWQLDCPLGYFGLLQIDRFIQCTQDEDHNGIIEDVQKVTDENGDEKLTVRGRTLEALLERRLVLGQTVFEHQQPAAILHQIIQENILEPEDRKRRISHVEMIGAPDADGGVVSYSGEGSTVLSAMESICQEAGLGFAFRADTERQKYILKLYKGTDRTGEDIAKTTIEECAISQLVENWDFSQGLTSWSVSGGNYGIGTVAGGVYDRMVRKQKVWERYRDEITKERYSEPMRSGYVHQTVHLVQGHLYYFAVRCNNPTDQEVGFGVYDGESCTFTLKAEDFGVRSALFVPPSSAAYTWALGVGNLSDDPGAEGESLLIDYSTIMDLTEAFGAGNEPDLAWCQENIYYSGGVWRYKVQNTTYIPNDTSPLIFSRERDVLQEMEYSTTSVNDRNVMYIQGDGMKTALEDDAEGIARKEVYLDLSDMEREVDGVTIPEASYLAMLKRQGAATLKQLATSELVEGTLYPLTNTQFRADYHMGDRIICQDGMVGVETMLRISGINEVWDTSGYTLSLIFGESVPSMTDTIKLVTKGAK